jgi:hypothetical protein
MEYLLRHNISEIELGPRTLADVEIHICEDYESNAYLDARGTDQKGYVAETTYYPRTKRIRSEFGQSAFDELLRLIDVAATELYRIFQFHRDPNLDPHDVRLHNEAQSALLRTRVGVPGAVPITITADGTITEWPAPGDDRAISEVEERYAAPIQTLADYRAVISVLEHDAEQADDAGHDLTAVRTEAAAECNARIAEVEDIVANTAAIEAAKAAVKAARERIAAVAGDERRAVRLDLDKARQSLKAARSARHGRSAVLIVTGVDRVSRKLEISNVNGKIVRAYPVGRDSGEFVAVQAVAATADRIWIPFTGCPIGFHSQQDVGEVGSLEIAQHVRGLRDAGRSLLDPIPAAPAAREPAFSYRVGAFLAVRASGTTATEVAARLALESTAAQAELDRLVRAGWAVREDDRDARYYPVRWLIGLNNLLRAGIGGPVNGLSAAFAAPSTAGPVQAALAGLAEAIDTGHEPTIRAAMVSLAERLVQVTEKTRLGILPHLWALPETVAGLTAGQPGQSVLVDRANRLGALMADVAEALPETIPPLTGGKVPLTEHPDGPGPIGRWFARRFGHLDALRNRLAVRIGSAVDGFGTIAVTLPTLGAVVLAQAYHLSIATVVLLGSLAGAVSAASVAVLSYFGHRVSPRVIRAIGLASSTGMLLAAGGLLLVGFSVPIAAIMLGAGLVVTAVFDAIGGTVRKLVQEQYGLPDQGRMQGLVFFIQATGAMVALGLMTVIGVAPVFLAVGGAIAGLGVAGRWVAEGGRPTAVRHRPSSISRSMRLARATPGGWRRLGFGPWLVAMTTGIEGAIYSGPIASVVGGHLTLLSTALTAWLGVTVLNALAQAGTAAVMTMWDDYLRPWFGGANPVRLLKATIWATLAVAPVLAGLAASAGTVASGLAALFVYWALNVLSSFSGVSILLWAPTTASFNRSGAGRILGLGLGGVVGAVLWGDLTPEVARVHPALLHAPDLRLGAGYLVAAFVAVAARWLVVRFQRAPIDAVRAILRDEVKRTVAGPGGRPGATALTQLRGLDALAERALAAGHIEALLALRTSPDRAPYERALSAADLTDDERPAVAALLDRLAQDDALLDLRTSHAPTTVATRRRAVRRGS